MARPKGRTLRIKLSDIDRSLLPHDAGIIGSSTFQAATSQLLRGLFRPLGGMIESLAMARDEVMVTWQPGNVGIDPVIKMLERGEYKEAILVLELLLSDQPDDPTLLYNLGMAHSDVGALDRAVVLLRRLMALAPDHVNGRIALGVALTRQRKYEDARPELERAVADEPTNPWAHRNLGACLLHLKRPAEAVEHLRTAAELNPADEKAWYGLGQALELTGNDAEADDAYKQVLKISEIGDVADLARQARSKMAGKSFRSVLPGMPRMDAVMYCLDALERFAKMTPDEVQKVGFEIAILGMSGLDVNDSTPKYRLRSLAGEFSGLRLVSIEYVAFKQIAPEQDLGFDLAREYEMALALRKGRSGEE
jgi:tetratricopeptide (TPR) repeat protein